MEEEMLSFFPGGLRVLLVDDDTKGVRAATARLSALHYPVVVTHPTASAGLRALSGDNAVDVQAVLCDVHKVVSSGFDFRRVVETELHIPVIYLLSTKRMVAGEDADPEFLNHLLLTATYIVRKPLGRAVMAQLWRVVAWRRCCLEERIPSDAMDIAANAGAGGEDDDDDVVVVEEPQVHFKAVRSSGSRKRKRTINVDCDKNRGSDAGGADGHPTKIMEHMNLKGLVRQHVARHLQEYRPKQQKKDLADKRGLFPSDSLFLKAILPMLNVPACNPLVLAAGAGPSSVVTAALAGGRNTAAPFQVPVRQQPHLTGNAVIDFNNNAAPVAVQAPVGNAVNNAAAPGAVQAPAGNAVISFNNTAVQSAVQAPAMGQQLPGGVQLDAPQQKLYFGPFSYQGPPPPAMQNHINLLPAFPPRVGMVMDKGKAPMIELPFGQPVDDFLVGEIPYGGARPSMGSPDAANAYAYTSALQNNDAAGSLMAPPMEPMFSITEPIVATQGEDADTVVVASEENAAAEVEAAPPINAEPFMVPDQVAADSPVAAEEDIMFSLESLLGLDDDMMLPMEDAGAADAAAGDAAGGSLNGEEGDMGIGWELDLDLDDILVNNTNEFAFLDDQAGSE
ncbi:hypothetical protein E2562_009373 [Oryza meyeriana var. granulata]|uniref:Response regulatory domain-containing protein n=1 Tax=Oryza meyeriana var. granulata TaxID=110450 RepID=A0A6G1CE51_9ORYZ|nr:hypothetical protein E2562_009373 [Oryza meyeriana var. granulata]